jgi:hypothetical protein
MRRCTIAIVSLLIAALPMAAAFSQPIYHVIRSASGVEFNTTNYGLFGQRAAEDSMGLAYPRGEAAIQYLRGGGLWFAARKQIGDSLRKLTFLTYDPVTGGSWATPGAWTEIAPTFADASLNRVYYNQQHDVTTGELLDTNRRAAAWPLWIKYGYGRPSDPGSYVPDSADRTSAISGVPAILRYDDQFFSRYHDGFRERYRESDGPATPIGLEVHQNIYTQSFALYDNVVLLHYRVVNVSTDTLRDCYIASMLDPEIGTDSANDHAEYLRPWGVARAWSDVESSNSSGTFGYYMLEGPFINADETSPDYRFLADRRQYYDPLKYQNLEIHSFRNWSTAIEPVGSSQRYDFMAAERFDNDSGAGDRRMMITVGPFNMRPGDVATLAIGIAAIPGYRPGEPGQYDAVVHYRDEARRLYQYGFFDRVREETRPTTHSGCLRIHPNPTSSRIVVEMDLPEASSIRLRLVDMLGETIWYHSDKTTTGGTRSLTIDHDGIPGGIYFLSLETESGRYVEKLVVR